MTSSGSTLTLSMALGNQRHVAGLKDGSVAIPGVELHPIDVPNQVDIFRRMARNVEFDVAEMSVVSYLCAKEYGIPFSGLPVVLRNAFHHSDFIYNVNSGISTPKDLEGKRVGTRTYTVTPGVLDKGILSDEFGVNVDSITWVLAELEHVPQSQEHLPANVIPGTAKAEDLFPRLASGDIDAGIAGSNLNRGESPNVKPLFANAAELDREQYRRTGIIQPFTIVVVRDALLREHPWLAEALYVGFKKAKEQDSGPDPRVAEIVDGDPLPYGLSANRKGFEELVRLAAEQHIIRKRPLVEELFPALD
jgi:4,5-dihydroxyphthalate decarboxylase